MTQARKKITKIEEGNKENKQKQKQNEMKKQTNKQTHTQKKKTKQNKTCTGALLCQTQCIFNANLIINFEIRNCAQSWCSYSVSVYGS